MNNIINFILDFVEDNTDAEVIKIEEEVTEF